MVSCFILFKKILFDIQTNVNIFLLCKEQLSNIRLNALNKSNSAENLEKHNDLDEYDDEDEDGDEEVEDEILDPDELNDFLYNNANAGFSDDNTFEPLPSKISTQENVCL